MNKVLWLLVFGCVIQPVMIWGQTPELYELRVYVNDSPEKQELVDEYLKSSLVPALHRAGLRQVGVFKPTEDDHSMFLLLPFKSADQFVSLQETLEKDQSYQDAASDYFDQPLKNPAFQRINSRLLKAFGGMPVLETSELSQKKLPRVFELRLYESHTEDHARRKVQMFDEGEIQLMKDVEMGPVFFAKTIAGSDAPNLVYMLSAANMDEHKKHWNAFLAHPEWDRMKKLEPFKGTVSKIQNWFLVPTDYSDL